MAPKLSYTPLQDEHDNEKLEYEAQLPWNAPGKRKPFPRYCLSLCLILSHALVAGLVYFLAGLATSQTCLDEDPISPWMSGIDRSFHVVEYNSFNHGVNNFTAAAQDAGADIEDWWIDLGVYGK
jgi:hypothetical protein